MTPTRGNTSLPSSTKIFEGLAGCPWLAPSIKLLKLSTLSSIVTDFSASKILISLTSRPHIKPWHIALPQCPMSSDSLNAQAVIANAFYPVLRLLHYRTTFHGAQLRMLPRLDHTSHTYTIIRGIEVVAASSGTTQISNRVERLCRQASWYPHRDRV